MFVTAPLRGVVTIFYLVFFCSPAEHGGVPMAAPASLKPKKHHR
jgi:hypothetical protein